MFNTGFGFNSSGYVYFSRELLSNIRCHMDLRHYPHDVQICSVRFESYFNTVAQLMFFNASVISAKAALVSSAFEIDVMGVKIQATETYGTSYPELVLTLRFRRKLEFHLYQVHSY